MEPDDRILDGVTVIDCSTFVTGGFCSMMLANQGATVIKVERPGVGDDIRHSGPPFVDGESPYYWSVNYGKQSVEIDLKSEAGLEALFDLANEADVFLQNFRPGTAERLGVDAETIRSLNEQVIYCAISAFGATGPWRERPGYDLLVQGTSGFMSVTGEPDRPPVKVGLPIADLITGMWAAFGIVTALYRREQRGEGETIDLGMLDAALPWLTKHAGAVFAGETPSRMGTRDPVLAPYQTYETADGHLNVACLNDRLWKRLCVAVDREELLDDERFETNADRVEHMDALTESLQTAFRERSTDEWMTLLVEEAGVPAGPVFSVEEALYNEQTEARGTVTAIDAGERGEIPAVEHPIRFANADSGFELPPPELGEHTRDVFRALGYDEDEIDDLAARGAFGGE